MKTLVTGGAGFIGSHVVDALVSAGHQVAVVDNLWELGGGRLENVNQKARFYQLDVRDESIVGVFEKVQPEVVFHLAAQHSVKLSTDDPAHDAQVNVLGLINLLGCCTRFNTRKVVFSSSGATYGTVDNMPIDERTAQHPESPYAITKLASEGYLQYWRAMYGLDYAALRYGNVYGPRQDPLGEAGVIAIFTRAILLGEQIRIDWDGEQQKDYIYVEDVARANLAAISQHEGEAYCIASEQGTSVNSLHRELVGIVGQDVEVVPAPKRPGDIYLSYFNCQKAVHGLGWEPQVSLGDGLQRTVDYFKDKLEL